MLRAIDFHGLKGVEFSKGEYTALLIPEMGANLVRLADTRRGIEILRAPAGDEVEECRRRPHVFGLPILFPPNRIADGQYTFDGRTYRFPITDATDLTAQVRALAAGSSAVLPRVASSLQPQMFRPWTSEAPASSNSMPSRAPKMG